MLAALDSWRPYAMVGDRPCMKTARKHAQPARAKLPAARSSQGVAEVPSALTAEMLGLQRSVGNHVVNTMLSSRIARDADVDALDLEATAKDGATELKKKHTDITFT